jgi:hypothetical protein
MRASVSTSCLYDRPTIALLIGLLLGDIGRQLYLTKNISDETIISPTPTLDDPQEPISETGHQSTAKLPSRRKGQLSIARFATKQR